ncbi:MAG: hypothetical protein ACLQVN_26985 [Bryobacteraceae bacterium]
MTILGKRFFPSCGLAALSLLAAASASAQTPPAQESICAQVPAITRQLTEISGLELKHPVPCHFISKREVNEFLKKRVKEVASPAEIRAEELTLKKFGLVPADYDLAKNTIDLLTEQAAAFYDYNRKKLFITETTPFETQEPVLAHELSHALADQNFDLARYTRQGRKSDDGSTARLAVMEGQATWLMSEYLARRNGTSLKDNREMANMMSAMADSSGGQYPVFENAPLYLRDTLVFPYTKGMLFQQAVFERDGQDSFAEVFRKPPVSTQQILHPERYFSGVQPTDPQLPDPHLGRAYKSLIGGSLGELEHGILLRQYAGKQTAEELAPHWRGSNFELREDKKAGRVVLLYAVEWDSADAARRYFEAYRELLQKKWKKMEIASRTADSVTGSGDDGRFELRRDRTLVTSVEGLAP